MKGYYLNCSRNSPTQSYSLDIRGCLCTHECPKQTRKKCKSFKVVPENIIDSALAWIKLHAYAVNEHAWLALPLACKKLDYQIKKCTKCSARYEKGLDQCSQCVTLARCKSASPSYTPDKVVDIPIILATKGTEVNEELYIRGNIK